MAKKRICASCRNGESEGFTPAEAEFYVKGKVVDPHSGDVRPYQAYLCRGHMEMMLDDGAEFPVQREL